VLTKKNKLIYNILNQTAFLLSRDNFLITDKKQLLLAMTNYTSEDLIQYLYQETSEEETKAIEKALQTDWNLKEEFEALEATKQGLDKLIESPRPQSITAILNYAKTTAAEIAQR